MEHKEEGREGEEVDAHERADRTLGDFAAFDVEQEVLDVRLVAIVLQGSRELVERAIAREGESARGRTSPLPCPSKSSNSSLATSVPFRRLPSYGPYGAGSSPQLIVAETSALVELSPARRTRGKVPLRGTGMRVPDVVLRGAQ